MDEEKATAYYDEMRRKGGGAAKLKQGLGYATPSSPPPQAFSYHSFPSFVKGDDHSESLAKQEKESRLAVVRDKLKKRPIENDDADGHGERHKHNPCSQERSLKRRHHSQSRDREHTARSERSRTHRRRESSSSSSRSRDCRSQSHSSSGDSNYRKGGRLSCERSINKREKRSRESLPRARRTSRPPRQSSRRSHSSSPRAHGSDNCRHSYRDSRHPSHRSRSPYAERQRQSETKEYDPHIARKPDAKLIAGYDNMTPAERVKEKMKLQLSETVSKDTARGMDTEWERFAFNKNAPLDDDAKLDYFGDGTGAQDDTGFLQNTGSTFLSTCSQARREAQIQAAHDTAIFGPFTGLSSTKTSSYEKETHDSPTKETTTDDDVVVLLEAPPISSLLSDQVFTFQQGSWRERALKLKQQRAASTIT